MEQLGAVSVIGRVWIGGVSRSRVARTVGLWVSSVRVLSSIDDDRDGLHMANLPLLASWRGCWGLRVGGGGGLGVIVDGGWPQHALYKAQEQRWPAPIGGFIVACSPRYFSTTRRKCQS